MKYWVCVCEGLADEPVEDLAGRTPLEAAKTPALDRLARRGSMGRALFVPDRLLPTPDVALMSILGYDPLEHYTGIAPLDALSRGLTLDPEDVVFRCDFVTALGEAVMDETAGGISSRESAALIEALNRSASEPGMRFIAGEGHRNFLVVSQPDLRNALDELECEPLQAVLGRKWSAHLPHGKKQKKIAEWTDRARGILEPHEINRVRIDLGENPANMIWLWGQGKKPNLPSLKQVHGRGAALSSSASYARGLGRAAGLELFDNPEAGGGTELHFYYAGRAAGPAAADLKQKIRHIEEFDARLAPLVDAAEKEGDVRFLVTSPVAESLSHKKAHHGEVPWLVSGAGVSAGEGGELFSEKAASQAPRVFRDGFKLLPHVLSL